MENVDISAFFCPICTVSKQFAVYMLTTVSAMGKISSMRQCRGEEIFQVIVTVKDYQYSPDERLKQNQILVYH